MVCCEVGSGRTGFGSSAGPRAVAPEVRIDSGPHVATVITERSQAKAQSLGIRRLRPTSRVFSKWLLGGLLETETRA